MRVVGVALSAISCCVLMASCQTESGGDDPVCGDGIVEGDEQCDEGESNSDTTPDACRTTCRPAACGDGVIDQGELCDDGDVVAGDGCSAECQVELNYLDHAFPYDMALDATHMYWVGDGVYRILLTGGGSSTTVADPGEVDFLYLTVDATQVYWLETRMNMPGYPAIGRVWRVAKAGGTPELIASTDNWMQGIAVAGDQVYWSTRGFVWRVPLTGGSPTEVVASGTEFIPFTTDASSLYWTEWESGDLIRTPLGGGPDVVLATGQNASWIVVNGAFVYLSTMVKVPIDGGDPIELCQGTSRLCRLIYGYRFAVDSSNLYTVSGGDPNELSLIRIPIDGGEPTVMASGLGNPGNVLVDEHNVYFTIRSGTIEEMGIVYLPK